MYILKSVSSSPTRFGVSARIGPGESSFMAIAVRIMINKNGIVIDATPGVKGTTLNDRELWQKCKDAVMGARLTQSESAPNVQIGVVVFNFKVK